MYFHLVGICAMKKKVYIHYGLSFCQAESQEYHNYFTNIWVFFFKMMIWFGFVGLVLVFLN